MTRFLPALFCALILAFPTFCAERERSAWAFPENYGALLHDARKGNEGAQDQIAEIIYKGIMRYPSQRSARDAHFFAWLENVGEHDSFARRVARLMFMKGKSPDFQRTFDEIKAKAHQGDPFAQRTMGSLYFYTELVEDDPKAGVAWYDKAAKQGHARAQLSLALRYMGGSHMEEDTSQAMKWLNMASDAGLPEAQSALSTCYSEGRNVPKDMQKALHLLKAAANGGDTLSQIALAGLYLGIVSDGWSEPLDNKEGEYWLDKAQRAGDTNAMFMYGTLLIAEEHLHRDIVAGMLMLKQAASLGNEGAIMALAEFAKD
ncbi:MAG: sel1 repeat family protein [Proteobacteria bacterium]|nr:sel1 repeat family protein [Pseudomonadota bacterium]